MRYFFLFLIFTYTSFAVDVNHYNNIISDIQTIYDSPKFGTYVSNHSGIYKIDLDDKSVEKVDVSEYSPANKTIEVSKFFEMDDKLYCLESKSIYSIENNKLVRLRHSIDECFYHNDILYMVRSTEPRFALIENGQEKTFYTGDSGGSELKQNFITINDTVYVYLTLNWTGNTFIARFVDSELEYITAPGMDNYKIFEDSFTFRIENINDELWFSCSEGVMKYQDGDFVKVDENNPFVEYFNYLKHFEAPNYLLNGKEGIYRYNWETQELVDLKRTALDYEKTKKVKAGKEKSYFQIGNQIFSYKYSSEEFKEEEIKDFENIIDFIEDSKGRLIVAKDTRLEIYDGDKFDTFSGGVLNSNYYCYLNHNKDDNSMSFLGYQGNDLITQNFDGAKWDIEFLEIPDTENPGEFLGRDELDDDVRIGIDKHGIKYLSGKNYLGIYDGTGWENLSLMPLEYQGEREEYRVLCTDSSGGVWISSTLYYDDLVENYLLRFENQDYKIILKDTESRAGFFYNKAICLRNGKVYIKHDLGSITADIPDDIICYKDGEISYIELDDLDDHEKQNEQFSFNINGKGNLVLCFNSYQGYYRKEMGGPMYPIKKKGGILEYDDGKWKKGYYNDVLDKYNVYMYNIRVVYDKFGNDYILTQDAFYRLIKWNYFDVYDVKEYGIDSFFAIYLKGNSVWFASKIKGLFRVDLDNINDIQDEKLSKDIIKNKLVTNNNLSLNKVVEDYVIVDINGQKLMNGNYTDNIDVSELSSGVYFIICNDFETRYIEKIVIRK